MIMYYDSFSLCVFWSHPFSVCLSVFVCQVVGLFVYLFHINACTLLGVPRARPCA